MIHVMVVEDQSIVRQGIGMMLEEDVNLRVAAMAENGRDALEKLQSTMVDLVIMDIRMPVMNGIEATREIRKRWPAIKILILTTFNDDAYTMEALREGANGYLLKTADSGKLLAAVNSCLKGGLPIQEEVTASIIPKLLVPSPQITMDTGLSGRELEIVACVGQGKSNKEISQELYLTVGTVKNHITAILQKLGLRDRTQLAIYAVKHHLS